MGAWLVKRQLKGVGARMRSLREELAVLEAGLPALVDDADDSQTRAIVSGRGWDAEEARTDGRHAEAHATRRATLVRELRELEIRQDQLLDKLSATQGGSSRPGGGR